MGVKIERSPKAPDEKKTNLVRLRLTESDKTELQAMAEAKDLSMSEFIREAVAEKMEPELESIRKQIKKLEKLERDKAAKRGRWKVKK